MILNLKEFNKSVEHHHFKMDTLDTVTKMIKPGCYVASVDLKDAYYTVPIQEDHQNFLKFGYKVCLYKYTCLPNGLSSAPRIFTKMIKPGPYKHGLYWWLILARWHQGWMQAYHCQHFEPVHWTRFLHSPQQISVPTYSNTNIPWFYSQFSKNDISPTPGKIDKIVRACRQIVQKDTPLILDVARVISLLITLFPRAEYR